MRCVQNMKASCQIQVFRTFDLALEHVWRCIQGGCDHHVFQSYEWISHWHSTVGWHTYKIEPVVAVVLDGRLPLALFPFGIRRAGWVRVLEFLGGAQCDYNAPLVTSGWDAPERLEFLWNMVMCELPDHDVRSFVRMPAQLGHSSGHWIGFAASSCEGTAYAAALPDSWDEFQRRLPIKFRKDNARMVRRLSEKGRLEFRVARTISEFNEIVEVLFAQKQRRYRETGARNVLADIYTRDFYRGLGRYIDAGIKVHLSALRLDEDVLATHLGVIHRGRYYYLFPAYGAGEWAKYSPGRLLLENLIQWAISQRLHTFDFTVGAEEYKALWCDSEMSIYRFVLPLTIRGRVFAALQALGYWVKTNRHARSVVMSLLRLLYKVARI